MISFSGKELTAAIYVFPTGRSVPRSHRGKIDSGTGKVSEELMMRYSDTDIDSVVDALVAAGEYLADHGYN